MFWFFFFNIPLKFAGGWYESSLGLNFFLSISFTADEKCLPLGEHLCPSLLHRVCTIITSDLRNYAFLPYVLQFRMPNPVTAKKNQILLSESPGLFLI